MSPILLWRMSGDIYYSLRADYSIQSTVEFLSLGLSVVANGIDNNISALLPAHTSCPAPIYVVVSRTGGTEVEGRLRLTVSKTGHGRNDCGYGVSF